MNIEEAKKKLLEPQKISLVEIIRKFKREGIENFIITRPEIVETLLTAYEKEKEKNKNAIKYIKEISPLEVGRAPNGKMMYDHNLNQDEIYGLLEILEEE